MKTWSNQKSVSSWSALSLSRSPNQPKSWSTSTMMPRSTFTKRSLSSSESSNTRRLSTRSSQTYRTTQAALRWESPLRWLSLNFLPEVMLVTLTTPRKEWILITRCPQEESRAWRTSSISISWLKSTPIRSLMGLMSKVGQFHQGCQTNLDLIQTWLIATKIITRREARIASWFLNLKWIRTISWSLVIRRRLHIRKS